MMRLINLICQSNIKSALQNRFREMFDNGVIDRITFDFLCGRANENPRLGRLFLLPKMHKLSNEVIERIKNGTTILDALPPCRPIISQCNAVTERISRFIDYFLVPIVRKQKRYIRDSGDFINQIETLNPDQDCFFVSFDCTSMYTNMEFDELTQSVERAYDQAIQSDYSISLPDKETMVSLVSAVLKNNYFEFNGRYFKQIIGASQGSKCSPEICDIRADELINEILDQYRYRNKIAYLGRYRDDFFAIMHTSTAEEIKEFFHIANNHHPLLKFTYEISDSEMIFLDTVIFKGNRFAHTGVLDIKIYIKPTNTHQNLQRASMHNPSVFSALIKGEAIRYRRNCSDNDHFTQSLSTFKTHLLKRGYAEQEMDSNFKAVSSMDRTELLRFELQYLWYLLQSIILPHKRLEGLLGNIIKSYAATKSVESYFRNHP